MHNWIWNLKFHSKYKIYKDFENLKLTIFTERFTTEFESFLNYKTITEGNLTCILSLSFSLKLLMPYNEKRNPYTDSCRRIWITLKPTDLKSFESIESCLSSCAGVFEFEDDFEAYRFEEQFWMSYQLSPKQTFILQNIIK